MISSEFNSRVDSYINKELPTKSLSGRVRFLRYLLKWAVQDHMSMDDMKICRAALRRLEAEYGH